MKRITANQYQTSERYYKLPKLLFESERYKDMKLEVKVAYAVLKDRLELSLGRELRVIVGADKIDDKETEKLSNEIAKKIQDEMTYPGQVKITVIREIRSVSYAK